MQALAASCEELRARTGNPPLGWPPNLENKTFFDISNGVRKKFLNLNIEDIGAKKGFKHVLTRICEGKFFCTLT
jgi:hypothetical protein